MFNLSALLRQALALSVKAKGKKHSKSFLIDQGSADPFLEKQLLTDNFVQACKQASQPAQFNMREGYDHSYYFISSFIDSHIEFHTSK